MVSSQNQAQSDQSDEIFLAFKEWLNAQRAELGRVVNPHEYRPSNSQRKEFHVSPSIAALEPSIGMNPREVSIQSDGISSDSPSMGRRVFRNLPCEGPNYFGGLTSPQLCDRIETQLLQSGNALVKYLHDGIFHLNARSGVGYVSQQRHTGIDEDS